LPLSTFDLLRPPSTLWSTEYAIFSARGLVSTEAAYPLSTPFYAKSGYSTLQRLVGFNVTDSTGFSQMGRAGVHRASTPMGSALRALNTC